MPRILLAFAVLGVASASSCIHGRPQAEAPRATQEQAVTATMRAVGASSGALPTWTAAPETGLPVAVALRGLAAAAQPAGLSTNACPDGMAYVSGDYCPEIEHRCVRWMETGGRYAYYRCAEYARPAKCISQRRPMKYCIDRDEYVPPQEHLPASNQSWTRATEVCGSLGKRVCMESEWQFACEGEEMRPYPYGFVRDADACNADRVDIYRPDGKLLDLREGPKDHPKCTSPFGVHHLSGNLEEWTTIDGSIPPRPAMKGAYWQPSRNHCRAAQTAHDRFYNGTETGFRCCKDVR